MEAELPKYFHRPIFTLHLTSEFLSDEIHFYDDRLALLWFHTIVRPFFGLDGSNSRSGADAAQRLIDGAKPEFAEASLFLFFQGRVNRLKVN